MISAFLLVLYIAVLIVIVQCHLTFLHAYLFKIMINNLLFYVDDLMLPRIKLLLNFVLKID